MSIQDVLHPEADPRKARRRLQRLRHQGFSLPDCLRITRWFDAHGRSELAPCRVTVLRSLTLEPIEPYIRALGSLEGLDITTAFGPYNQFEQVLEQFDSTGYRGSDFLVLAFLAEELFPKPLAPALDAALQRLGTIIDRATKSGATVLVTNFVVPSTDAFGFIDPVVPRSERRAVRQLNEFLEAEAARRGDFFVLDVDALAGEYGKHRWFDERQGYATGSWMTGRPLHSLAELILRFVRARKGKLLKCAVLDCDNTLWGGIVGEDGLSGIQIGHTYPGSCYRDFQQYLLELRSRGILLAACSKNNPEDAEEVFQRHPDMLIRRDHLVASRIGWSDKVGYLREIAQELNIGLDSMVFIDDSEQEIAAVEEYLPEVTTFLVPCEPAHLAKDFRAQVHWDTLSISEEDRTRSDMYVARQRLDQLRQETASLDEFYRQLDMTADIARLDNVNLPRVSQLTQKTNQFNLTTVRYSERELRELDQSGRAGVFAASLSDRFGQNGIVGVLVLTRQDGDAIIDTLLMSCRVIGRTLEQSMLAFARDWAEAQGAARLIGKYLPSKKNRLVADLYQRFGFEQIAREGGGGAVWSLDVARGLPYSPWISVRNTAQHDDRQQQHV